MITLDLIAVLQGVLVIMIGAGLLGVFRLVRSLTELQGRVGQIEACLNAQRALNVSEFAALRRELDLFHTAHTEKGNA